MMHIHTIPLENVEIYNIEFDILEGKNYEVNALGVCEDCGEEGIEIEGISEIEEPLNDEVDWNWSFKYVIRTDD